jgi:6-pyruvoyltetrahydropterin/6-carboxytetrahydropterin synthase
MLTINKIFHFEAAHAIAGYPGLCRHIHGHRYELHVGVTTHQLADGMIIDLKLLKKLVNELVIDKFDHALIVSEAGAEKNKMVSSAADQRLIVLKSEPTVEYLILEIKSRIEQNIPANIRLMKLKLYETRDSYAEWNASVG